MGPLSNEAALPLTPGPASGVGGGGGVGDTTQATRQRTGASSFITPSKPPIATQTGLNNPVTPSSSSATPLPPHHGDEDDEDYYDDANKTKKSKSKRPPPSLSLTLRRASNACRSLLVSGSLKKKLVSLLMALVALVIISDLVFTPPDQRLIQTKRIKSFLIWVQSHPVKGVLAYVMVYASMVVLLLPGTPLTIGSGYIYKMAYGWGIGVTIGSIFSTLGSLLGSVLCFCLGRYLMKETVKGWVRKSPMFGAIDDAVGKNGFKIMSLLYLSPILPLGPVSYMCGTTSMKLAHFAAAKVACVPLMIFYVFLGASAGTLVHKGGKGGGGKGTDNDAEGTAATTAEEDATAAVQSDELDHLVEGESTGMIIFAILLSAASMALISHFVKKELMKVLNEQKAETEVNDLAVLLGNGEAQEHDIEMSSSSGGRESHADEKKIARQRRQISGNSPDNFNDSAVLVEDGGRGKDV